MSNRENSLFAHLFRIRGAYDAWNFSEYLNFVPRRLQLSEFNAVICGTYTHTLKFENHENSAMFGINF